MSSALSGSADLEQLISEMMQSQAIATKAKNPPKEYQIVSGSGDAWYYNPSERKMLRVKRGSEILVLTQMGIDDRGRVHAVDLNSRYFLIPFDEVIDVGYN